MAELVILTAVLLLLAGVAWHVYDQTAGRRLVLKRKVLVSLHAGRAITGVLYQRRGRMIVLKSAQLLEPGTDPVAMDGDVVLDRDQVEYMQAAG